MILAVMETAINHQYKIQRFQNSHIQCLKKRRKNHASLSSITWEKAWEIILEKLMMRRKKLNFLKIHAIQPTLSFAGEIKIAANIF